MIVDTFPGRTLEIAEIFERYIEKFRLYLPTHEIKVFKSLENTFQINYSTNGFRNWYYMESNCPRYETFLHLHISDELKFCYINSMSIDSTQGWRNGYGGELLSLVEDFANEINCEEVQVYPTGEYMIPFFNKQKDYSERRMGVRIKRLI